MKTQHLYFEKQILQRIDLNFKHLNLQFNRKLILILLYLTRTRQNNNLLLLGQATKSVEWMPWHREPMKDVISCEKLRGVANKL